MEIEFDADPLPVASGPAMGARFHTKNKTICHDFVRRDGVTVQCKAKVDEDGYCTNDVDEHITRTRTGA